MWIVVIYVLLKSMKAIQFNQLRLAAFSALFILMFQNSVKAQNTDFGPAIGQWRSFLSYYEVTDFDYDAQIFYCATQSGFFTFNRQTGDLTPYSKVNGMHDLKLSKIAVDPLTEIVILAYQNSNIDLFKDNKFVNMPDLKLTQISGDKSIHHLSAYMGTAYVSTGIGLILINLEKQEIKETIRFFNQSITAQVFASEVVGQEIYAATSIGLFKTNLNNTFINNYLTWDKLSDSSFTKLSANDDYIFVGNEHHIYRIENNQAVPLLSSSLPIVSLNACLDGFWLGSNEEDNGSGYFYSNDGIIKDSIDCRTPTKILSLADRTVWLGDKSLYFFKESRGFWKREAGQRQLLVPIGPVTLSSYDISAHNKELWVAHGGISPTNQALNNRAFFSRYVEKDWYHFPWISNNVWFKDIVRILKNPISGKVYAGSFSGGLVIINPDFSLETYGDGYLPDWFSNPGLHNVSGLALDSQGNLWITNYSGNYELSVMTPNGQFYHSRDIPENSSTEHSAKDLVIDDYGQKWFISPANGGVIVYDDNGTIDNTFDDRYRILKMGEGHGGLLSNAATSIAKDKDGSIWIGTDEGISIVYCPREVINGTCEASPKVVEGDNGILEHLFARQNVATIAVDEANRKWIGTDDGVWLLSENGEEVLERFNVNNSPLPSNEILRINIDAANGDVYFSTQEGIVCYRGTATQAPEKNSKPPLLVYPNPVPSNYEGMIAVKNVWDGADVRFTDIAGQLVYRTKAAGGQAVWNGRDYLGNKAQSGVYLIFIVSKDGTQKREGKLILQR